MMRAGFATLVVALVVLASEPAQAYLDAGSGSMMLQVLLGGFAGLVVVIKLYWRRLLGALRIGRSAQPPSVEMESTPPRLSTPEQRP